MGRCHQLVTESEPASQLVLSGRKSKSVLAQVKPLCVLIYFISMGACLKGKVNSQGAFTQSATPVTFPLPSQKGDVVIQKMLCQNVHGASPSSDLGKPPQICANEGFSQKPTCIN